MLIWRGWGIVVAGIALVGFVGAVLVADALNLSKDGSSTVTLASLIPAGVATWYLGRRMNRNAVRELIDPATGEIVQLRSYHDFFFVRVEWWGLLMVVFGVFAVTVKIVVPPS